MGVVSTNHMFSLAVTLDGDADPRRTATCDRCGREIDVEDTSQVVFRVKGLQDIAMRDPNLAESFAKRLRDTYRARQPMVVDSDVEVEEIGRGFDDVLLAHARACTRA